MISHNPKKACFQNGGGKKRRSRCRSGELENDHNKEQVNRNLRQSEIVDFMRVEYPMYSWSLRIYLDVSIILESGTLTSLST